MLGNTFFCNSSGKKQIVALTGLGLSLFVLIHMAENMLLFVGPRAYNLYTHFLTTNPFLPVAEILLALFFVVHIYFAASLAFSNRAARGMSPYRLPAANAPDRARFGSRSMIYTGALVLVFVALHLWTFKYGTYYTTTIDGVQMRDLYRLVVEKFAQPIYLGWYLFSLLVLGVHLSHGFSATFQSLGFGSVRNPSLKKAGWAFAIIVAGGFITQPIYTFLHASGAH